MQPTERRRPVTQEQRRRVQSQGEPSQQGGAVQRRAPRRRPAQQQSDGQRQARQQSGGQHQAQRRPSWQRPAQQQVQRKVRKKATVKRAGAAQQQARRLSREQQQQQLASGHRPNAKKRAAFNRSILPILLGAVAVVLALSVGACMIFFPSNYDVTINGETRTVHRGDTIAKVIEDGYASPVPGDLLAVDGSVLTAGGGDKFAATVNGEATTDPDKQLEKDAVVDITDGEDKTEEYESKEETIPHGQSDSSTEMDAYWTGALHVYAKGQDGVRTTKTGKTSGKTVEEDTKPAIDSGYTIYSADPGDEKIICLTFDDGPWGDTTDDILDVLEENGAVATFFTIGNQIAEHPENIKRENELGCQVATHTWDHAEGSGGGTSIVSMSADEQVQEVEKGMKAIEDVLGVAPSRVMRAPGGNFYGDAITNLEPYLDAEIGWDVDTEDWQRPGADAIYETIMNAPSGSVILMHDGGGDRTQTVAAIQRAVPELAEKGYRFLTVDEMLAEFPPKSKTSSSTDSKKSSDSSSSTDSDSDSDSESDSSSSTSSKTDSSSSTSSSSSDSTSSTGTGSSSTTGTSTGTRTGTGTSSSSTDSSSSSSSSSDESGDSYGDSSYGDSTYSDSYSYGDESYGDSYGDTYGESYGTDGYSDTYGYTEETSYA